MVAQNGSRLRQLQRAYFAIYDEWLATDLGNVADLRDDGVLKYFTRTLSSGIACVLQGVPLSAIEYRLARFTQDIERFWYENAREARQLAQALPGWHLQLPYNDYLSSWPDTAHKLATYFDTLFVFDGMATWDHRSLRNEHLREVFRANFRRAAMLQKLRPLALLELDQPIVAILSSYDLLPTDDVCDNVTNRFYAEVLGDGWERGMTFEALLRQISRRGVDRLLNEANKSALFRETVQDLDSEPRFRKRSTQGSRVTWKRQTLSSLPPNEHLATFLWEAQLTLTVTFEYYSAANEVAADALVGGARWRIYRWLIERGISGVGPSEIAQESVAAVALTRPMLNFLQRISTAELLALRDNQNLTVIRSAMAADRNVIKRATYGDFTRIADQAAARLLEAISAFSEESAAAVATLRKRRVKDIISLTAGVAMGVASAAMPELGIPALLYGTVVGSQSVQGLLQTRRETVAIEQVRDTHPLGVLFRLKSRSPR